MRTFHCQHLKPVLGQRLWFSTSEWFHKTGILKCLLMKIDQLIVCVACAERAGMQAIRKMIRWSGILFWHRILSEERLTWDESTSTIFCGQCRRRVPSVTQPKKMQRAWVWRQLLLLTRETKDQRLVVWLDPGLILISTFSLRAVRNCTICGNKKTPKIEN